MAWRRSEVSRFGNYLKYWGKKICFHLTPDIFIFLPWLYWGRINVNDEFCPSHVACKSRTSFVPLYAHADYFMAQRNRLKVATIILFTDSSEAFGMIPINKCITIAKPPGYSCPCSGLIPLVIFWRLDKVPTRFKKSTSRNSCDTPSKTLNEAPARRVINPINGTKGYLEIFQNTFVFHCHRQIWLGQLL